MKSAKTPLSLAILLFAVSSAFGSARLCAQSAFLRGDTNQDTSVDLSDAQTLLSFLFVGGADGVLRCQDAADANDDGTIDITDSVRILEYLFLGQSAPPAPGPNRCGVDPTPDFLSCKSFDFCSRTRILESFGDPLPEGAVGTPEQITIDEPVGERDVLLAQESIATPDVTVRFSNQSAGNLDVFRVESDGEAQHLARLAAEETYEVTTVAGTEFRFEKNGQVDVYVATNDSRQQYGVDIGSNLAPVVEVVNVEQLDLGTSPVVEIVKVEDVPPLVYVLPPCDIFDGRLCQLVLRADDINDDGYVTFFDVLPEADVNGDEVVTGPELRFYMVGDQKSIIVEINQEDEAELTLFNYREVAGRTSEWDLILDDKAPELCKKTVETPYGMKTVQVECE